MTNAVKRAVELADGFSFTRRRVKHRSSLHVAYVGLYKEDEIPQPIIDALAAQLVRQVDATDDSWVTSNSKATTVMTGDGIALQQEIGPDRTMNTIKAIVDSGVLE